MELRYTRGTGSQTIDPKYIIDSVPVQSNPQNDSSLALGFTEFPSTGAQSLDYTGLLYELQLQDGTHAQVSPSWFGVTIPNPGNFNTTSAVYIVLYFHPIPGQAGYINNDYYTMSDRFGTEEDIPDANGNIPHGTDWTQLYAFADRLGGQMAAAVEQPNAPANNRLVIFPFLANPGAPRITALEPSEWGNVIHDIMQDINANYVPNICTTPKNVVVASLSNGSFYLNNFLDDSSNGAFAGDPILSNIVEVWDFDSDITTNPTIVALPHGIPMRAYWQNPPDPATPANTDFVQLPAESWINFPPPPDERPPLPPNPSNSNSRPDTDPTTINHHYIRDTMFLDAVWNLGNPNGRQFPPGQ